MVRVLAHGGLLLIFVLLAAACRAQSSTQLQPAGASASPPVEASPPAAPAGEATTEESATPAHPEPAQISDSRLGLSLLKNIVLDQKAIWTSPAQLRVDDANWLLPVAGIAAMSLASDTHISKTLTSSSTLVSRSNTFSNAGVAAFGAVAGGLYLMGEMNGDDRRR